jgi:hypothetical protein
LGAFMSITHHVLAVADVSTPFPARLPNRLLLCRFRREDMPFYDDEAVLWYLVGTETLITFTGPDASGDDAKSACSRFLQVNGYRRVRDADDGVFERHQHSETNRPPWWKRAVSHLSSLR